jgi:hypothetical protein
MYLESVLAEARRLYQCEFENGYGYVQREEEAAPLHPTIRKALMSFAPDSIKQIAAEWPHVADKDFKRLAYTQSTDKGMNDIQTVTSIGKYLRSRFPGMKDHEVRDYAELGDETKYSIVRTMEEMLDVLLQGPRSCMSHSAADLGLEHHPYEAYDPKYGWHMAVLHDEDGEVEGRALLLEYKGRKSFVRSYRRHISGSDGYSYAHEGLETWLVSQGYEHRESWPNGAKLRRIERKYEDQLICPYLDGGIDRVDDHGDYLMIDSDGALTADSSEGTISIEAQGSTCDCCGGRFHEEDLHCTGADGDEGEVCDGCLRQEYTYVTGSGCERYYVRDSQVARAVDGEAYDVNHLDCNGIVHCEDGEYRNEDDCVYIEGHGYYDVDSREIVRIEEDGDYALKDDCFRCEQSEHWYRDEPRMKFELVQRVKSAHNDQMMNISWVVHRDNLGDFFEAQAEWLELLPQVVDLWPIPDDLKQAYAAAFPDNVKEHFPELLQPALEIESC